MKRPGAAGLITLTLAVLFGAVLAGAGLADPQAWLKGLTHLGVFASDLFPPDLESLPILIRAMAETVRIAYAGTVLGFLLSVPLAYLSTRTLFGPAVSGTSRAVVGALRTVPSILFGVVFVVAFGLGEAAGILGVALYTVGYLGKIYYEAFEGVDPEVLEAVRGTGARRLQIFRYALLPEASNTVLGQALFMFEYNIRASAILGFVGAGGIGYYMLGYVQMLQYRHLMTALLVTFVVVMITDRVSRAVRARLGAAA